MYVALDFGQHKGKTPEQVALTDYGYFADFLKVKVQERRLFGGRRKPLDEVHPLVRRIKEVYNKLTFFQSRLPCALCDQPAEMISIYLNGRVAESTPDYIYCSREHFEQDSSKHSNPLSRRGTELAYYQHRIVKDRKSQRTLRTLIEECMGLDPRNRDELVRDPYNLALFFDGIRLRRPGLYDGR